MKVLLGFLIMMSSFSAFASEKSKCLAKLRSQYDSDSRGHIIPLSRGRLLEDMKDNGSDYYYVISHEEYEMIIRTLQIPNTEVFTHSESGDAGEFVIMMNGQCKVVFSGFIAEA